MSPLIDCNRNKASSTTLPTTTTSDLPPQPFSFDSNKTKSHFEHLSFAFGLLTGIGCNLSSFGLCFLINVFANASSSKHTADSDTRHASLIGLWWEMSAMLLGGSLICCMAVATLMLGNALLTLTWKMSQLRNGRAVSNNHDDDNKQDSELLNIINRFECRFLMGTIASGGSTILAVLISHWMGWVANSKYQGVPWLLYATEALLAFCFCAVWYCEHSYQEAFKKNDDATSLSSSLQTPLLSAAHMV
ncbi:hypothetical protein MPSEU_000358600 [Mayamaea pseudoterrestris]|nr:hypothetical protein MPSEU_000358600 [Mayamaea pseudoterrestris]